MVFYMNKLCKVCGVTGDAAKFYNGVPSRCCECHKRLIRENRAAKIDYYRAYDAKRYAEDARVKDRIIRYAKTDNGKAAHKRSKKKWRETNPEKRAAHIILGSAIRSGKITKPNICEKCRIGCSPHGHHYDYTKPLDVIWLCAKCHTVEHKKG